MSEFIGRTGSKRAYSYPDTRGGGVGPAAFARNFASGPGIDTPVLIAGAQIPWNVIDGGGPLGPDVPITPHVTGEFIVSGTVAFENTSVSPVNVQVDVQFNGISTTVPASARALLDAAPAEGVSTIVIPFEVLLVGFPLGVPVNIQIRVSADDDVTTVNVVANSSTLVIEEVPNSN